MRKAIKLFIGTILVGLMTSFIYDGIKNFPFLSTVWNILNWIWKTIFEFEFRVWQIILGACILYFIRKIIRTVNKQAESLPKFHSYKTDKFHLINWKWDWAFDFTSKKWYANNIKPICPKCATTMHYDYLFGNFQGKCPRCENQLNNMKDVKDIEAIIIDNIDKGLIN